MLRRTAVEAAKATLAQHSAPLGSALGELSELAFRVWVWLYLLPRVLVALVAFYKKLFDVVFWPQTRAQRVVRAVVLASYAVVSTSSFVWYVYEQPPKARAGTMTGAASEWTQVMNNIALLQQIIHAIRAVIQLKKQVEYMGRQVADFGKGSPDNAFAILSGFQSVLGQTNGIIFAGQSLKTQWELTHPGRVTPDQRGLTDEAAYRRIDESVRTSVSKTLRVLDVQADANDKQIFQSLQAKMETASGQLQAQKAANELLLEIIRQLMALRAVVGAHANMMGEFVGADAQRRQYDDAIRQREHYQGKYRSVSPIDWSRR